VRGKDVIGGRSYLDLVQRIGEAGERYSQQQAHQCKNQHEFNEAKPASHASE
jgi:hypothetical protein